MTWFGAVLAAGLDVRRCWSKLMTWFGAVLAAGLDVGRCWSKLMTWFGAVLAAGLDVGRCWSKLMTWFGAVWQVLMWVDGQAGIGAELLTGFGAVLAAGLGVGGWLFGGRITDLVLGQLWQEVLMWVGGHWGGDCCHWSWR